MSGCTFSALLGGARQEAALRKSGWAWDVSNSNRKQLCFGACFDSDNMSSESTSAPAAATGSGAASGEGSGRGVSFGTDGVSGNDACFPLQPLSSSYLQSGLAIQDLESLDVTKLNPLSPEVISRQATINIGTCSAAGDLNLGTSLHAAIIVQVLSAMLPMASRPLLSPFLV